MFPGMKREDRAITGERCREVLENCLYGIISTLGENGYPCGTPFCHVLDQDTIYIHFGKAVPGNVQRSVEFCDRVGFTCVEKIAVVQEEFVMDYVSVMVQGRARLAKPEEMERVFRLFVDKYCPDFAAEGYAYAPKHMPAAGVVAIQIENMTGKSRNL